MRGNALSRLDFYFVRRFGVKTYGWSRLGFVRTVTLCSKKSDASVMQGRDSNCLKFSFTVPRSNKVDPNIPSLDSRGQPRVHEEDFSWSDCFKSQAK